MATVTQRFCAGLVSLLLIELYTCSNILTLLFSMATKSLLFNGIAVPHHIFGQAPDQTLPQLTYQTQALMYLVTWKETTLVLSWLPIVPHDRHIKRTFK